MSPAFTDLRRSLAELEAAASSLSEEGTLRQRFVEALDAFLQASPLARRGVRASVDERLITGRPDARVGGVLFEVKLPRPRGPGIEAAVSQVTEDYLPQFRRRHKRDAKGVAYDGLTLVLLDGDGTEVRRGRPSVLARNLEAWLLALGSDIITPDDFVDRLGSTSPVAHSVIDVLWRLFQGHRDHNPFVFEVFQVWKGLYGVTTNLNDEALRGMQRSAESMGIRIRAQRGDVEEFLFVIESYMALLMKLLVARVVVQQRLAESTSLVHILTADTGGIRGLFRLEERTSQVKGVFEEDVFLWPAYAALVGSPTEQRELEQALGQLASSIDDVDLVGAPGDFLRLTYQRFLDPVSRRTLGEFYTSEELVNEVLDAVGYAGDPDRRVMDISCGSGTFLVESIRRAIASNSSRPPEELLQRLAQNVVGVDIHPFAVAMARVNYLIAISKLLEAPEVAPFRVPIFWADSLARLRPEKKPQLAGHLRAPIPVTIPSLPPFHLPNPADIPWDDLFRRTRATIDDLSHVMRGGLDNQRVWDHFWLRVQGEERYVAYEETLRSFLRTVVDLHNENRDMRWVPFLRNILSVTEHEGSCDFVVGNPPWVRLHNISPAIRQRLFDSYAFYADAGWRRGAKLGGLGRGFARQVDYSVAFVERGLEFLRPSGKLGIVTTSKVMHALYGNALRKYLLEQAPVTRLGDYSLCARPLFEDATNYPLVMAAEKRAPSENGTVAVTVSAPDGQRRNFATPLLALPILPSDREAPWALVPPKVREAFNKMLAGRNGRPRQLLGELDSFKARMGVKTALNRVFVVKRLEPVPEAPDEVLVYAEGYYDQRVSEAERQRFRARIERSMLRPLVRGDILEAWQFRQRDYIIWTHSDATGEVLPVLPPRARAYVERHSAALHLRDDYHRNQPIWTIFRVAPQKLGHKVAWQRISDNVGAVYVPPIDANKELLVPLDTAYLAPVTSADTGYTLAAFLNSLPARVWCLAYSRRDRGAYRHFDSWVIGLVPLPEHLQRFLESQEMPPTLHSALEISQALHSNPLRADRPQLEAALDGLVAHLYGLTDEDLQALREWHAFITPQGVTDPPPPEEDASEEAP